MSRFAFPFVGRALRIGWLLPALGASHVAAQDAPPPYLQIVREEVKAGRAGAAHSAAEAGWVRAFGKAGVKNYYIGMTSVYGPQEAWFVEGHASVAEIDDVNKAIEDAPGLNTELDRLAQADAVNISDLRALLAHYHPDLSNGVPVDLAAMRVWEVLVFHVKPGHEADFSEAAKLYKQTVEQNKIDMPWATYAVMAGMPGPAFLVLLPHRTLGEIDPAAGAGAALEKAFDAAALKRLNELSAGYDSIEDLIFAVNPRMSYMPADFVARDPTFWSPKAQLAAKPRVKPAQ
jgi:hypothetical protein